MNRDYEKVRSPEFLRKIPVATYIKQEMYIIHENMLIFFVKIYMGLYFCKM